MVALGDVHAYIPAMIRTGHVVAAFVGVVLVAWLRTAEPGSIPAGNVPAVLWISLFFGALWECIVRLGKLLKGIYDRRAD